jgi:hypothetical protein
MLQQFVDGFSVSASKKRPARAVFGFAVAVMLASLVPTDYPVFVSSAYAGMGDVLGEGVSESGKGGPFKYVIVSCQEGWSRVRTQNSSGWPAQTCEKVETKTQTPTRNGPNPATDATPKGQGAFSEATVGVAAAAAAAVLVIVGAGSDTAGTTSTTGTTGTR